MIAGLVEVVGNGGGSCQRKIAVGDPVDTAPLARIARFEFEDVLIALVCSIELGILQLRFSLVEQLGDLFLFLSLRLLARGFELCLPGFFFFL